MVSLGPVSGVPTADAGPDIIDYTGRPVVFTGIGTPDPSLRIILYEWDFDGDGIYDWNSTRSGAATQAFNREGEYNATLRVTQYNSTSAELLTATDTTHAKILPGQPVGDIVSSAQVKVKSNHRLEANFYDPDGGQLSYEWMLEGVSISSEPSFRYRFEKLGVFNLTLKVTDDEKEFVVREVTLKVVEEIDEDQDLENYWYIILVILLLVVVAAVAYRGILKGPSHTKERRKGKALTYDDIAEESPDIVSEASLTDRQAEPETRTRPRVVRPERVVASPKKAKGGEEPEVAAAPARLPCPECGTIVSEDGTCPFCLSNEAIDKVERQVRELQEDGYIIAEVEDRLETAKTELHVKNFDEVKVALNEAEGLMDEAVREHQRCLTLMVLVDDLITETKDRDLDPTKASNLFKLSKSFMKSGKYPKAIHYAERSRDFLLDLLEPFDLNRYFCEVCMGEVDVEDEECPHCERPIESGLIKRAKKELVALKERFESLGKDHKAREPIASQLEKVAEHVGSRSAAAANEHIQRAKDMLEAAESGEEVSEPEAEEAPEPDEPPEEEAPEPEETIEEETGEEGDPEETSEPVDDEERDGS
jgi:hypothetical protein